LARAAGTRAGQKVFVLDELLARAPHRAEPPCPHFGSCGGCAAQHMADALYANWKASLIADALARAGFAAAPLAPMARTPPGARRRADFALARAADGTMRLGFHARRSRVVVDLRACYVLEPRITVLLDPLRAMAGDLSCFGGCGSAVVNLLDHGCDLLLRTDCSLGTADRTRLVNLARALGLVRIAWARAEDAPEPIVQLAPPTITLSGRAVVAPPGAFLQASREGEAAIIAAVLDGLPRRARRIADLYAGLGTLSFALAARGRVAAFEGDAAAHAALRASAGGTRVVPHRRDLARQPLQPHELAEFDAVVLDPPHAGAAPQVAALAASRVPHVAYVSCNPAALARDARTLRQAGFALVAATPIDQFLWSAQLECVAHFAR
jgi:23S rRNA (uracil1939-C5)-methyltransferase